MSAVEVRYIDTAYLAPVSIIHARAFPNTVLGKLGVEAISRYYQWLLAGPFRVQLIGAFVGGDLVGFCIGGFFAGALSSFMSRERVFIVRRLVTRPLIICDAVFLDRFYRALRNLPRKVARISRRSSPEGDPGQCLDVPCGLHVIAVHPEAQGLGIGKVLMSAFEDLARQQSASVIELSVDPNNRRAISFYQTLGWGKVIEGGRWTGRMRKSLAFSAGEEK